MQSNPQSVKATTRSPKPMTQYPILKSIHKDGYPMFSASTLNR